MSKLIGIIIAFSFVFCNMLTGQIKEGFDPTETKSLIAICNSYTFIDLFGSDTLIIPNDFRKVFTSEVIGLDNIFQIYEGNDIGIISFRGSTTETSSWIENFYSAMIPAEGIIKVNGNNYSYKFANDNAAAVHSGYALSVVLLSPIIIEQINELNKKGIHEIFITGHSQGGALAHMARAYLDNLPEGEISSMNIFKTYSFANPMCGNEEFSIDYNKQFGEINMSYSVINTADFIPKMPMHFKRDKNLYGNLFYKSWVDLIKQGDVPNFKDMILQVFEPALNVYINSSNYFIERLISTSYISIDLPNYVPDINYFHIGKIIELEPFTDPKDTIDTTNMTKKEITELIHDKDGNFYDKKASLSQHKPYNYYVAILKEYFFEEYKELEYKYLPSNTTIIDDY